MEEKMAYLLDSNLYNETVPFLICTIYGFFPKIFYSKRAKNCVFAQKTTDFGPKNRLRIWGVLPPP